MEIERAHPELPPPVQPVDIEVVVLVDAEGTPFFGFSGDDYLTFGEWNRDVLAYIKRLLAIVDFYRDEKRGPPEGGP